MLPYPYWCRQEHLLVHGRKGNLDGIQPYRIHPITPNNDLDRGIHIYHIKAGRTVSKYQTYRNDPELQNNYHGITDGGVGNMHDPSIPEKCYEPLGTAMADEV